VKVVRVGDQAVVRGLVRYRSPRAIARAVAAFGRAIREGYFVVIDPAFKNLSGRPPLSLGEVLTAHREDLVDAA
jgi:NAD(P)H dehydrogenase (quinone)